MQNEKKGNNIIYNKVCLVISMLAITGKDKISLITDLRLYQHIDRYVIQYNKSDIYASYETKEEAMQDFIKMSSQLKNEKLTILNQKLEELSEVANEEK